MMDELGFKFGQNLHIFLDRHVVLRLQGIDGAKRFLDHFARKSTQSRRTRASRVHKEIAVV